VSNRQFEPIVSDAAAKIQVVSGYLFSLNAEKRKASEARFERAKQSITNVTAELGAALFVGLNCAACHRHHSITPRSTNAAPDLAVESQRVKRPWLQEYLRKPHAIRPAGFQPGDGSRMPDFRLSDGEVGEVLAALVAGPARPAPQVRPLSAFAQRKAGLLLADKLSCLGCHRLGEKGGRIGPDLTAVRDRLEPEYVLNVIQNPRAANPHTIMPRVPMSEELQRLVADFLVQQNQPAVRDSYLSLGDYWPTARGPALESAEHSYAVHCAPCHGRAGAGDGFNAIYLPRQPTAHAGAEYMSRRPDDTLFDGIHSGGGILNKSHYMPPWGETFKREQIAGLVVYLRELCRCQGPEWSRDGLQEDVKTLKR
jgi:cytochrome c oxidase cbb3-type subunit 3